ncbi:uncharacterized protein [Drosophila virilis]|uniref:uncharacterized protein isoform X1 n=1 Tax=Drosophila virilis TaxID=7244 RepID=UPI0038B37E71
MAQPQPVPPGRYAAAATAACQAAAHLGAALAVASELTPFVWQHCIGGNATQYTVRFDYMCSAYTFFSPSQRGNRKLFNRDLCRNCYQI